MEHKKIGFIGAGNMATAIIEGILKENPSLASNIYVSHPSAAKTKKYSHLKIASESTDNQYVVKTCDIIILCVKPQILEGVCSLLRDSLNAEQHLIISICAGIDLKKLNSFLSSNLRISRCTLNIAALISSSCSVYSQNGNLIEQDKMLINQLLSSVGPCYGEVKDSDMDAAMAVCGCGIAYMFMFSGF